MTVIVVGLYQVNTCYMPTTIMGFSALAELNPMSPNRGGRGITAPFTHCGQLIHDDNNCGIHQCRKLLTVLTVQVVLLLVNMLDPADNPAAVLGIKGPSMQRPETYPT